MQDQALQPETFETLELPQLRPWRELALVAQIVMELAIIVPWFRALTRLTFAITPLRVFLGMGAVFLVNHLVTRLMNYLHLRVGLRRVVLAVLMVASILFGLRFFLYASEPIGLIELFRRPIEAFSDLRAIIPDEFVVALMMLLVVLRGISTAGEHVGPRGMALRFQIGVSWLIFYLLLVTSFSGETPGVMMYVFLFAGLLAIGSARLSVLYRLRGGRQAPFNRAWFAGLLVATALVILLAFLATRMVELPLAQFLLRVVEAAGILLLALILLVLTPFFLLVSLLVIWVVERLNLEELLPELTNNLQDLLDSLRGMTNQFFELAEKYLPDPRVLKPYTLWGILITVLVVALLWVGVQWIISRYRNERQEELESLLERGSLLDILRQGLRRRLNDLAQEIAGRLRFGDRDRMRAAARIRQIYADLMEMCEQLGRARAEAQTPLEYLLVLQGLFPEHLDDAQLVTRAYLRIRYGELPESRDEVEEVEQAWQRMSAAGKEQLQEKKRLEAAERAKRRSAAR